MTSIAMIFVDAHGENAIGVLPGANATNTLADAETALAGMQGGDVLMLQQEITQAATERALDLARAGGVGAAGAEVMRERLIEAIRRGHGRKYWPVLLGVVAGGE